jgi:hypothetical protein
MLKQKKFQFFSPHFNHIFCFFWSSNSTSSFYRKFTSIGKHYFNSFYSCTIWLSPSVLKKPVEDFTNIFTKSSALKFSSAQVEIFLVISAICSSVSAAISIIHLAILPLSKHNLVHSTNSFHQF